MVDAPVLEVTDLEIVRARSEAAVAEDVSFELRRGEVLGLVGESGSGKTTVALALLGHARRGLRIKAGTVTLDGTDLLELGDRELRSRRGRRIAYVPQDPTSGLNPVRRIGDQLREALEIHRKDLDGIGDIDERVGSVLAEVSLPATDAILQSFPHQLSGGQQQRVAIAMAFACRPAVIVMDEPTTGLDVTTQRHILETIRSLTESYGIAAVYVSHDLPVVAQIAHRVAVMYAGRLVEIGPEEMVLKNPVHPYTIGLLAAAPSAQKDARLTGIDGQPPRPGSWPRGCGFAPRCYAATAACGEAVPALVPRGEDERCVRCIRVGELPDPNVDGGTYEQAARVGGHLEASGIVGNYGAREVLHGVDVRIEPGICTAVVGESGSGKTTLARCLIGMHHEWTGKALFDGTALESRSRDRTGDQRRLLQYVFQNPYNSLNPRRTIGEALDAPLRHFFDLGRAERRSRVARMLKEVALDDSFADRFPDELSGGERQRVAIGRALIVEPTLLICDEVTSALDVSVQAVIVEMLRRIRAERGVSMLFITHNLALVHSVAEDVIVLKEGTVVEAGKVDRVLTAPEDEYTMALLADSSADSIGAEA
jgi:peptide/nickel transport system ATP-binding protein